MRSPLALLLLVLAAPAAAAQVGALQSDCALGGGQGDGLWHVLWMIGDVTSGLVDPRSNRV